MPPKTVALIGAVCLTTGWLLASMLTPPIANLQDLPDRRATAAPQPAPQIPSFEPFSERLQSLLRQAPAPPVPKRNPFSFGNRSRSIPATASPSEARQAPAPPPAPIAVGPRFTLSGTAVTDVAGNPVHTAVLSDGYTVHLVKAGDTVGGYRVLEVTESSVMLEAADGAAYVLRLPR